MNKVQYNDSVRIILAEVETFLLESIQFVTLPKNAANEREAILQKIEVLRQEYPSALPPKVSASPTQGEDSASSINIDLDGDPAYSDYAVIHGLAAIDAVVGSAKAGFLSKRRKMGDLKSRLNINSYQKRWCVIRNNNFYYYKETSDKLQKGAFSLAGYEFREAPFQVTDVNKKEVNFQLLRLGDRTYEFLALSKDDMLDWKTVIEKAAVVKSLPVPVSPNKESESLAFTEDGSYAEDDEIYEPIDGMENLGSQSDFRPSSDYNEPTSTPVKSIEKPQPVERRPPPVPKRVVPDSSKWKIGVSDDYGNMFYGKWDCTADADNELAFKQGDIIHVLSKEFEAKAWWIGELEGKIGLVPKQYLSEAYERVLG